MADVIPQLFISNYVNNNARALVSPLNEKLMKSGAVGEDWKHTYSQVRPGDIFTPPVQFDSDASSNLFGQAYFKPVGVLNNGNCYSACDLFSANMQDNSAAWIFGEDKETGAGGANVVEYNGFFSKLDPKLFKPMPYTDLLPTYHQDLRIGWRQTVRTGKNDGKLIEDIGIIADSVVRPTVEDIASKSSTTQWNRIAAKLSEIAKVKGTENLYFQASPQVNIQSPIASPLNFKLDVSGVSSVSLKGENQLTMVKLDVKPSSIKQEISLSTIPDLKKAGFYRLQITAKDAADKTVVETYRFLRLIPSEASFVTLTPSPVKMAIEGPGYAVFNKATADANGWKADGAMLRIGAADAKYADNVNSRLSIFANPSAPLVKCLFKATYDTEENFDFLHVGYVDESGEYDLLLAADKKPGVSGTGKVDESFVFQPKGKFELFAQFLSDGGVGQTGVVVETFEISNGATATSSIAVSSATLVPSATAAPEPSLGSVTRTVISASSGPVPTAPPTHPSDVPASPSSPSRPTEPSAPQGPPAQSYPVATPNPHPGIGYKKNYGMEGMYNAEPPSNVLSGADARPLAYLAYACLAVFVVL